MPRKLRVQHLAGGSGARRIGDLAGWRGTDGTILPRRCRQGASRIIRGNGNPSGVAGFWGAGPKEELLEMIGLRLGEHHGGAERWESDEQKAERLVLEELRQQGWTEQDLEERRNTDATYLRMATRSRSETVMTLDWIADRCHIGCRHTVANCLKG